MSKIFSRINQLMDKLKFKLNTFVKGYRLD